MELCHIISYSRTKSLWIEWVVLCLIPLMEGEVVTLTLEPCKNTDLGLGEKRRQAMKGGTTAVRVKINLCCAIR